VPGRVRVKDSHIPGGGRSVLGLGYGVYGAGESACEGLSHTRCRTLCARASVRTVEWVRSAVPARVRDGLVDPVGDALCSASGTECTVPGRVRVKDSRLLGVGCCVLVGLGRSKYRGGVKTVYLWAGLPPPWAGTLRSIVGD